MLPSVLLLLEFSAGASDAAPAPASADESKGGYLLLGAGCWVLPILAAVVGVLW